MQLKFASRLVASGLFASGLFALCLTGCTSPVATDADSEITTAGRALAFSYDTTVDVFAHMSCSNMPSSGASFSKSGYFSYRMGAYYNSGVTLNNAFYTSLKKYNQQKQSEILQASPANASTVPQLALRGRLAYQNVYTKSGSTGVQGQDYFNMLSTLGGSDTADLLVNNPAGGRIKHLRSGAPGGYQLEGSLYFGDNANLVQATRDFLSGNGNLQGNAGLITITYTNGTDVSARSQADTVTGSTVTAARSVFGRGFLPTFSVPATASDNGIAPYSGYPMNVVTSLTEQSLDGSTLSPAGIWNCPAKLQLKIVRKKDAGVAAGASWCQVHSDPATLTADLVAMRKVLKVEDWYIDADHQCAIPKHTGLDCYGTVTPDYVMSETCSTDPTTGFSNCAQWVSLCVRQN